MIYSMTGYAAASIDLGQAVLSIEIKSVNSRFLDIAPSQVMMVACHPGDLDAAKSRGLMAAYVHRPLEWGPGTERPLPAAGTYDVIVHSFTELAEVMGA